MRKIMSFLFILICSCLAIVTTVHGQKYKVYRVNASTISEGDRVRGPRSIKPVYVNRIRYRVSVKTKTTLTAGPSLALPFIPPSLQAAGAGEGEGGAIAIATREDFQTLMRNVELARDPEDKFRNIRMGLDNLTRRKAREIQNPISSLVADTNAASRATKTFVQESDSFLLGGPPNVLRHLPAVIGQIDNVLRPWPDQEINEFLTDLEILEGKLLDISDARWLTANKDRVDEVRARIRSLRESVIALSHNNQSDSVASKFDEAQRVLRQWRDIFADAQAQGDSFFELPTVDVGCGGGFDQNKETEVTLVKQDRLGEEELADQELVTVFCSSPFSISGGFGFSSNNEREFVFVPSTKTVTENGQQVQKVINRFGFRNNSSFRPIPLLLLNTRIHEPNDTIAFHLSAGAGVDIKTGEAGTDVEFIVGPTVSFKRSLFLTTGLHIGRVPKLAGGFQLDQEVPEGISEPPIEKAWKTGFIVSFTYKLR